MWLYQVCKLSNETDNVAFNLGTLEPLGLERNIYIRKMSDIDLKQRCTIRLSFKLGHSATETLAKLQPAYGGSVL